MVEILLRGLKELESDAEVIHLNLRFSDSLEDIGKISLKKIYLLFLYSLNLIWIRMKQRPEIAYYVPAPPKRSALYRDFVMLTLTRALFSRVVLHWHAVGLGAWLSLPRPHGGPNKLEKLICRKLYGRADLSIVLGELNRSDAEVFQPKKIVVIYNGIPDFCPSFVDEILPERRRRLKLRSDFFAGPSQALEPIRIKFLFLSHCTEDKGLFDAIAGLGMFAESIAEVYPTATLYFAVAGVFPDLEVKARFESEARRYRKLHVDILGFVSGAEKVALLESADCMVFPTYYANESLPVTIIEALSFGLPVLTTHWRANAEIFGENYPFLIPAKQPEQIADKLKETLHADLFEDLRNRYLEEFSAELFLRRIFRVLLEIAPVRPNASLQDNEHSRQFR